MAGGGKRKGTGQEARQARRSSALNARFRRGYVGLVDQQIRIIKRRMGYWTWTEYQTGRKKREFLQGEKKTSRKTEREQKENSVNIQQRSK